jgi:zinc-ribbon domain
MTRKIIVLGLVFISCLWGFKAQAQGNVTLASAAVDLWPEYDRPNMLVIYHLTLSSQVSPPVELSVRIPSRVGDPHAVAVRQPDGALFSVVYEREVQGDWALITFTATSPDVQLEYYDPDLIQQDSARHYEFQWPGDYAVDSLVVSIQQPIGATDMRISPGMGNGQARQDGLVYYTAEVGALQAGEDFSVTMDYQKTSDELSASSLTVEPSAPITDSTAGRMSIMQALPWALGVLGLVLILGGGIWYWQSGRQTPSQESQRRRRKTPPPVSVVSTKEQAEGEFIYCHQCGKRASPNDRFCRVCGARLRVE